MSSWQNHKIILHIFGEMKLILHPFVHWSGGAMFVNSHFGIHIVHVLACLVQHPLVDVGDNHPMCHYKAGQFVSNTNIV